MKRVLLLVVINVASMHLQAFMLDRVILATDAHVDYIEFWPLVARAWKEVVGVKPTLALIAHEDVIVDESLGDVIRFEPIEGVPTSFQAQAIRLLLPALFEDEVCIVSDIDMLPLNKEYFIDSVKQCARDTFVVYRDNAYRQDEAKFPMCYVAGAGKTFKDIFSIHGIEDIKSLLQQWHARGWGWNTDELVLHEYVTGWSEQYRLVKLGHGVDRRIDRSCWMYDPHFITQNYYIDAHCPRPYSAYKDSIDAIMHKKIASKKIRFLENADYGTHMAPLLTMVVHTDGPVLEMGSGDYSTPLLHALCSVKKRLLLTTDTDKTWLQHFIDLENDWHKFKYVPVYDDDWSLNPKPEMWDAIGENVHWSVVLIDHRPGERRIQDVVRLRDQADIFVVHDSQQSSYGYDAVLDTFKYKYVYPRYSTQTTIVSDTIDIRTFFEE